MSNRFYNFTVDVVAGTRAKAAKINDELDAVTLGFQTAQDEIDAILTQAEQYATASENARDAALAAQAIAEEKVTILENAYVVQTYSGAGRNLATTDHLSTIHYTDGTTAVFTVADGINYPDGFTVCFVQGGAGTVTIDADLGITLLTSGSTSTVEQGSVISLQRLSATLYVIAGDM